MPYDEYLVERVRIALKEKRIYYEEKKLFGNLCFMVDDKICVCVNKKELLARVDPESQEELLKEEPCRILHESMKGFLFVAPEGIDMDEDLGKWIDRCLEFNPRAKSSKKNRR